MLLAGPNATLRGKLTEKVKYRPTAAIEPLLPAGTDALDDLPAVRPGVATYDLVRSEPTNEELTEYGEKIKRTAAVFARSQAKQGTLAEHDTYTVWVATYMQLSGFGTFVVVDDKVRADRSNGPRRVACVRARACECWRRADACVAT